MNPMFFGTSKRQLFGAYEAPAQGVPVRPQGVVMCPPLASEYLVAHPSFRLLARQLAATGYHVLRFDYFGTGDSGGEFEETDQEQWLADIETAITELKDLGQVSRVILVGLRYGATLAAHVARQRHDVDRLVLWDVITNGAAYLAEFGGAPGPDDVLDAGGIGMSTRALDDVAGTTPAVFGAPIPKTLITVTTPGSDDQAKLCAQLRAAGIDCDFEHVPDIAAWREGTGGRIGADGMPVGTLRRIVSWLA